MTNISINAAPALDKPLTKRKRKQSSVAHDRALTLLIFLPPALLLFTLFVILPMGEAAWYSLYRWNGYGAPTDFIGLKNFQVLFGNAAFSQALINNALIIVISICIQIPLAIWLAGQVFLGDYLRDPAGSRIGGPWALIVDFVQGLAAGSPGHWMVLLGPYVLVSAFRGAVYLTKT